MNIEKTLTQNYRLGMDQEKVITIEISYGFEYNCHESWGFAYRAIDFLGNRFTDSSLDRLLHRIDKKQSWPAFKERK